jgi:LacI family transcriptional regulator
VTIRQIAELAGVSHGTVSNILNGRTRGERADAQLRCERVRSIAEELGYRPHLGAINLRRGRTGVISLLGWTLMNDDEGNVEERQLVQYLASKVSEAGYHLSADLRYREAGSFDIPPWSSDAAVLISPHSPDDVAAVENLRQPYVSINGPAGPSGWSIEFDDSRAMNQLLERLYELGHRRIAFVNAARYLSHTSASTRADAYLHFMKERGLSPQPGHQAGDVPVEAYGSWLDRLLRGDGVTAIVTFEPFAAMQLYRIAAARGLRIPDDLSLVTFNDTKIGRDLLHPPLSAVARPVREAARVAAELVHHAIEEPSQTASSVDTPPFPRRTLLEEYFVERGSVAAVEAGYS